MRASRRVLLFGGITLLLGAGACTWWWRAHVQGRAVASSVPPRPALTRFPPEFTDRVTAAERQARNGEIGGLRELASLYQVNGLTAEATQCLEALIALQPSEPRWLHRLASLRAGYGELDRAIELWRRTVDIAPEHVPAWIRLGDAYLKTNRDADGAGAYEEVLRRQPDSPFALVGLARIDLKADRPAAARERLERASERSGLAIGTDLLVTVYEETGDHARAEALRSRAKSAGSYYDPPDAWVDEMLEDCYDVFRLKLAAGFAHHRGDSREARRLLERAAWLAPQDGHVLLQLGMLCRGSRDPRAALLALERAAKVDPTLPDVWAQLVSLYSEMGDAAASARALAAGLQHCPRSPGLHLERGRRMAAAGQHETAVAEFRETLRLRPDEADPLIEIAQIRLRQNRTEEAIGELRRALLVEPEHPLALTTLALYAIRVGDEPAARDWLRRARIQVRVGRDMWQRLAEQYQQRFGHAYQPDAAGMSSAASRGDR